MISRMRAIIAAALVLPGTIMAQAVMQPILVNGPSKARINIVYLSEGYTPAQLPRFVSDASNTLDAFLGTSPFNPYRASFNAYAISIASRDSGSDHPSRNVYRETFFHSTYDTYGITRLVTLNANGVHRVDSLLELYMPEFDIAVVIVNDPEYGGSGGYPAVASVHSSASEIVIHELGHSFAELGDEYSDAYPGYPDVEEPNTTRETVREKIKWRSWIDASTPVPTPQSGPYQMMVGLFEGAHYHPTGWYRPMFNCKMRALGVEFCPVCAETIVRSIYGLVRPIASVEPATASVALADTQSVVFRVLAADSTLRWLDYQWFIDGVEQPGASSPSLGVAARSLPAGTHLVHAIVRDMTPLVRNDSSGLLRDSTSWLLTVGTATAVEADPQRPVKFALAQNYPNPFNPSTTISFSIPNRAFVTLKLFDTFGREIARLVGEELPAGTHTRVFTGAGLPSGMYFYRLQAGASMETKGLLLLK